VSDLYGRHSPGVASVALQTIRPAQTLQSSSSHPLRKPYRPRQVPALDSPYTESCFCWKGERHRKKLRLVITSCHYARGTWQWPLRGADFTISQSADRCVFTWNDPSAAQKSVIHDVTQETCVRSLCWTPVTCPLVKCPPVVCPQVKTPQVTCPCLSWLLSVPSSYSR